MAKILTAKQVENAKAGDTRREIPDGGTGLYLVVQPSGTRSWAFRYRYQGKPKKLTLGTFPLVPLADSRDNEGRVVTKGARTLAREAHDLVAAGRDPSAEKQADKSDTTLKAICEDYLKCKTKLRSKGEIESTLKRLVYETLGDRQIAEIRRSDIKKLLDSIATERGEVMADKTLAHIRRIMNWYTPDTDDFRPPIMRNLTRTKPRKLARARILSDDEIRAIWKAAGDFEGPFGSMVRFIMLTATRRTEAADLTDGELIGDDWIIPAARYKTGLDHVVPLSKSARAVLGEVKRIKDVAFVFTTGETAISGFSKWKADFDEACGATGWTLHDLRRTARSLMSRIGIDADIAERCLGHVITGVRGVYDRHAYYDEKKRAFEALAQQIEIILKNEPAKIHNLARAS